MADTYKSAWRNLIYLGEDEKPTKSAFETMERVYEDIWRKTSDFSQFHELMKVFNNGGKRAEEPLGCELTNLHSLQYSVRHGFSKSVRNQGAVLIHSINCNTNIGDYGLSKKLYLRNQAYVSAGDVSLSIFLLCLG
jgi:hypothetical protein